MAPVLAIVWFLIVALLPLAPARADFEPQGLSADAASYAEAIRAKAPPQATPAQRAEALKQARAAVERGDFAAAVNRFEALIALGEDGPPTWLALSEAWTAQAKPGKERALQAAYLAYRAKDQAEDRVAALWRMAALLEDRFDRPADALQALQELKRVGAKLAPAGLDARFTALRQRVGLTLRSVKVNADDGSPRACFRFSGPLSARKGVRFGDFLRVEPPVQTAVDARNDTLCLSGLTNGKGYTVTLRKGLPGDDDIVLNADETQRIRVPDRKPLAAFRGSAFILPRGGSDGIPVVTVNLDAVAVKVYRLNDRNLVPSVQNSNPFGALSSYSADDLADRNGELVWQGRLEVHGERNQEVVTALSFRDMVDEPKPGVYAVTVRTVDVKPEDEGAGLGTQWVLVSDIGLTTFRGADGITVFARSFATAKPLPGVEVALVARNNGELARVTTDALGRARFPAGLSRGNGGNAPVAVMAYAGADFATLDLSRAAFDLSDRGVGGRKTPGPMDAFVYTERGVYRQGETVHLGALLRDDRTEAVENFPLTVKVLRPSGTEYFSGTVQANPAGGFFLPLTLSRTAPLGGWTVQVYTDPKGEPVGSATFQVEDFVPERLALDLTAPAPYLEAGKPFELLAQARFLYGPPGAGLSGTAEVSLQPDPAPYPQHKGFRFGLVQDNVEAKLEQLEMPTTDAAGQARIAVTLPKLPDTTRALRAEIRVAVSEPGGRPTRKSVIVPVRTRAYAIGLRPHFEGGRIGEGQEAAFDVLALGPDGTPLAKPGLSWELVEERTTYQWYLQNGRYNYRSSTRDIPVKSGTLAVGGDKAAALTLGGRDFGRYRLEVTDKAAGVASSVRFYSGWRIAEESGDAPDKLDVAVDKPAYRPGETARVRIVPPFAGEVLLTVATDRLFDSRTLSIPAEGATVEVPVDAAWGPGAYVTATVYRPPVKGKERQPVRALGVAWIGIDPAVRTLDVALQAPTVMPPRGKLDVGVKVTAAEGAAMEDTYVTLAAVDEGILRLTDYAAPQPGKHFFGKRGLGLDIRDDYGRLIDALDGPYGTLRQGGDSGGGGLPVVPFTVVSLFQGPVKVGPDGTARVAFDIPDFNGEIRLMAVAYSRTRVGSATGAVTVRDPLVAELATPRFLAPGDDSRLTLSLHNVEAAEGAYTVEVGGEDGVAVENGAFTVPLARGERKSMVLPLKGTAAGIGRVSVAVRGPDGAALDHSSRITVRPARPVETQFLTEQVAPGGTSRFDTASLSAYLPGTAGMSVSYTAGPPFDVAGILRALDRYPYGCLEQTISRALPLLVVRDVELALGVDRKPDDRIDARIDEAIGRTLDRQRFDGAFGLWGAYDEASPWLTAYTVEFLVRARDTGHPVPDKPLRDALSFLRQYAVGDADGPEGLAAKAYALHAFALAGVPLPGPARYLHDTALDTLPTPLAKGQLGATLARLGDAERAASAFDAALAQLNRKDWHVDYGSTVRDAAALLVLAGEVNMTNGRLAALVDRLPASATAANRTNTQEKAWIVLAANALTRGTQPVELALSGGAKARGERVDLTPSAAQLAGGLSVANAGKAAVWQAVAVSGVPTEARPAAREGLRIKRNFFKRDGQPLDLEAIHQNDVFVVVLEGEANTGLYHQTAITHPLPAGWEIENPRLGGSGTGDLPWLGELTHPLTAAARDDRYIAAVDLTEESKSFKLAFVVRAVTPGVYELPGAVLEDMYKPRFFARQAAGRITVLPAP
ncbi:MG2 domain-containing protein [Azospirillum sp. sgz301742]